MHFSQARLKVRCYAQVDVKHTFTIDELQNLLTINVQPTKEGLVSDEVTAMQLNSGLSDILFMHANSIHCAKYGEMRPDGRWHTADACKYKNPACDTAQCRMQCTMHEISAKHMQALFAATCMFNNPVHLLAGEARYRAACVRVL
jgi:hypothetical protein